MSYVSGEYTAVYNAKDLGQTQDGWRMEAQGGRKAVTTDRFGDMEVDGVYRGVNVMFEAVLKEWNATGMADLWWPYSTTLGRVGVIGRLEVQSLMVKPLVLTALAGTPAATVGPLSITATNAILEAEFAKNFNLNNEDRSIPIRIRSYPYIVTVTQVDHVHVFSFT